MDVLSSRRGVQQEKFIAGTVLQALPALTFLTAPKVQAMNTWTKEPWKRDGYDIWHFGSGYEREAGDQPDPHRFTGITLHEKLRESPVAIACMDRIVACVNACARIPDPAAIAELRKVCQQLADAFPHDDFDKYDAADFKDNAGVILDAAINARAALSKLPNHKGE